MTACQMDDVLQDKLRHLNFSSTNSAVIMKMEGSLMVFEAEYEDTSLEDLRGRIPKHEPRFIAYTFEYTNAGGFKSCQLCLILSHPTDCKMSENYKYSCQVQKLVEEIHPTKTFDVENVKDLSDEWLKNKLAQYGNH